MTDLDVDGAHFPPRAFIEKGPESGAPQTSAAVGRSNEEIVDESIKAAILHTESDGQHDVTRGLGIMEEDPNSTQGIVLHEGRETGGRPISIERVMSLSIKFLHQV